jgi:hypothetical protein
VTETETLEPTETETGTLEPTETPEPTETMVPVECKKILDFTCQGPVGSLGSQFGLRLVMLAGPTTQPATCTPVVCPVTDTLVQCNFLCRDLQTGAGGNSCLNLLANLASGLIGCITQAPSLSYDVSVLDASHFTIEVTAPFECEWCLCGDDFGLPCSGDMALPLPACNDSILCQGISIQVLEENTPTPTPTSTLADTETPTETETATASETPTSPPTDTQTATATPTNTLTTTLSATPTDTPKVTETPTPTATVTETATATETATEGIVASPTPTRTPGCDSGLYMLVTTGQIIRVGHPVLITGGANYGFDFAKDIERATADAIVSPPTADLVLLDGAGVATFVENPADTIPQTFTFPPTLQFPMGRAVDLEMSQSSEGLWVLTDFGGIYRAGDTKAPADPALVPGTDGLSLGYDIAYGSLRDPNLPNPGGSSLRAVALGVIDVDAPLSLADGFIVIDSQGGHYQFNGAGGLVTPGTYSGAPANDPHKLLEPDPGQGGYVWPFFPGLDIARDIEVFAPTQEGAVVFDGWGGIHPVPVNDDTNAVFYTRNEDPILHTPITTVGMPYIVDGFDDPETGADEGDDSLFGIDVYSIFVDFEFSAGCPDGGFYTLDKNGGVFVFGTARPNASSTSPAWPLPDLSATQNGQDIELFAADETELGETEFEETKFGL